MRRFTLKVPIGWLNPLQKKKSLPGIIFECAGYNYGGFGFAKPLGGVLIKCQQQLFTPRTGS